MYPSAMSGASAIKTSSMSRAMSIRPSAPQSYPWCSRLSIAMRPTAPESPHCLGRADHLGEPVEPPEMPVNNRRKFRGYGRPMRSQPFHGGALEPRLLSSDDDLHASRMEPINLHPGLEDAIKQLESYIPVPGKLTFAEQHSKPFVASRGHRLGQQRDPAVGHLRSGPIRVRQRLHEREPELPVEQAAVPGHDSHGVARVFRVRRVVLSEPCIQVVLGSAERHLRGRRDC